MGGVVSNVAANGTGQHLPVGAVNNNESTQKGYEAAATTPSQPMRLRYVIPALLLIPLADTLLLVPLAGEIGLLPTVLLVVLTGLVGMLLVRAEGRHTLNSLQRKLAQARAPTDELLDGALLVAAGAFLLTPGVVTDALGFLLALPVTRYPIRAVLKRYVVVPALDKKTNGFVTGQVWTSGFPEGQGFGGDGGQSDDYDDDVYDVGPDSYRVDDDRDRADG
jgi:UPF0716 protein FxsA